MKTADAFLPENGGTYAVEYENGAAVLVQRTEEAPDLEVDVTTRAQRAIEYQRRGKIAEAVRQIKRNA